MTRQSHTAPLHLDFRAVLEVSGPEAADFLQSLVTSDARALAPSAAQWSGLLTPQGRILFDFFIVAMDGGSFLLDVSARQRPDLLQRMRLYKLRREVTIAARDDLAVAAGAAEGAVIAFSDPRLAEMGTRAILPAEAAGKLMTDAGEWHARRIALGLPDSDADIGSGRLFPHEANFDQLGAVSFSKGCYIGQEVVSRMHHRGTARSRLLPLEAAAPLDGGARILAGEKPLGEVFSTAGRRAIALIRLDRAAAALEAKTPLLAEGVAVRPVRPAWASFDVPGA